MACQTGLPSAAGGEAALQASTGGDGTQGTRFDSVGDRRVSTTRAASRPRHPAYPGQVLHRGGQEPTSLLSLLSLLSLFNRSVLPT